jgi:predicted Zn-dependent protease
LGDGEINLLMGEILVAELKYPDAEPFLKRGLPSRPDLQPRVHALLGRVYAALGREKEAIEELRQGVASDEDGGIYYQFARLYHKAGDAKAANAPIERSRQIKARHDDLARRTLLPGN